MRKTILIVALVVFVLLGIAGGVGYWMVYGVNTPEYAEARSVKILPDASFDTVVDSLVTKGILKNPGTFSLVANATGWSEQVKPGHYSLESGQSNYDLLNTIRKGLQTPVRITIPPGSRPDVVAAVVSKQLNFPPEDFLAALEDVELATELSTDTLHLFSYMLPETYFVYWLTDAKSLVKKVKGEFDQFFTPQMKQQAEEQELSVNEVLRVASIVEWETNHVEEKPDVAGVYLNRLHHRDYWRLDADPTVEYALLQLNGKKQGRWGRLFTADYKIDHPYNTYKYRGLPPGPINNPSPSSIKAVLQPRDHNYMFFVAKGDGSHTFTRTLSEHIRASREFHRLMRQKRREKAAAEAAANQAQALD